MVCWPFYCLRQGGPICSTSGQRPRPLFRGAKQHLRHGRILVPLCLSSGRLVVVESWLAGLGSDLSEELVVGG
jgi:hypothetical protein